MMTGFRTFFQHHAVTASAGLMLILTAVLTGCISEQVPVPKTAAQEPVLDPMLAKEDFDFPSRPPRLSRGKAVFAQNCATCHRGAAFRYDQFKTVRPIDTYLLLTRGDQGHPNFKKLSRDQRWEAVYYARYIAGGSDVKTKDIAALFGGNCAVCHGSKGFADGPLHTGHASAHELGIAPLKGAFDPPPANFHSYARMYNRTDDQLVKFISEGIYPSAMPSWKGRQDKDKGIVFDEQVIRDLVKYIRMFAYENDLPPEEANKPVFKANRDTLSAVPQDREP